MASKSDKKYKQIFIIESPLPTTSKRTLGYDTHAAGHQDAAQRSVSVEALYNDLNEFNNAVERKCKNAISTLRDIINNVSPTNRQLLMTWTDERGFDILHIAIVNNKPNLIHFLLHTSQLFPPSYKPKINPYAHLAATLGHLDCLKEILSKRPDDFFKTSTPQHAIRLPIALLPRPKLTRTGGVAGKNTERLIRTIKEDTAIAERALHDPAAASNLDQKFMDEEVENLKKSFKVRTKEFKPNRKMSFAQLNAVEAVSSKDVKKVKSEEKSEVPITRQNVLPKAPKPKVTPKITVYWDIFKDDNEGVVRGAGEPVEIMHVLDKKQHHVHNLERTDIVSYKKKVLPKIKAHHRTSSATRSHANIQKSRTSIISFPAEPASKSEHKMPASPGTHAQPKIELGVRRIKKYKDFIPVVETRLLSIDDPNKYYGKSPLTMAAEKGHVDCVNYILQTYYLKKSDISGPTEPLTLATKARSPESLLVLLDKKYTRNDFQSAVLLSIRELYPDCLSVLLNLGTKEKGQIFDGTNLFHILYSQSLIANYRYEMLPEMTRVLVHCREDVNARYPNKTYPMYTLIQCAFNVAVGKQLFNYLECLTMLLQANANPHFNEDKGGKLYDYNSLKLSRPSYTSAIQCVLVNANLSLQYFEKTYWSQIIMQKFIDTIATYDKTPRRVDNDILFTYMEYVPQLGLNRRILRVLLRYGANPDCCDDGRYPLTMFFEQMFAFLTKFQVRSKYTSSDDVLNNLLILCRAMTPNCLHEAVVHFLDHHLLSTPLQALDITRKFCYYTNKMITSPRSLSSIVAQSIWLHLRRNSKQVQMLPLTSDMIHQILP